MSYQLAGTIALLTSSVAFAAEAPRGTGSLPMDPELYRKKLMQFDRDGGGGSALPARFDWREEAQGSVTPARDQKSCGSCWAFAAIAVVEARIAIEGGPSLDLSEQFPVEYDWANLGCFGGNSSVFEFLVREGVILESCLPYTWGDSLGASTYAPVDGRLREDCPRPEGVMLRDWHTVDGRNQRAVKQALLTGPLYGAFDYHDDFGEYWRWENSAQGKWPDGVYRPLGASLPYGGHAIMIFGWDDDLGCWLCKNSWGRGGPFGDGTLRFRYGTSNFPGRGCAGVMVSYRSPAPRLRRGAVTAGDARVDVSDAVEILRHLFSGEILRCEDAADIDDSGTIIITDAIVLLQYLFSGGPAPAAPFPACAADPTEDDLGCEEPPSCPE